jgi:hypothetical protein
MARSSSPDKTNPGLLLFILAVAAVFSSTLQAADCTQSDITLTTQAEVDGFQASYGGGGTCDRITGTLSIRDSDDIANLDGLSGITSVERNLLIFNNTALTNVDALSALTKVADWLRISGNSALVDIDGLSALTNVGDDLTIFDNSALTNIDGLSSLDNIDTLLEIQNNDALTDLEGLRNVLKVNGAVRISDNNELENLKGLWHLRHVGGDFSITDNDELGDMAGLSDLKNVGGHFTIRDNPNLTSLDGLFHLASVGSLDISQNRRLKNLDRLEELISADDEVSITDNKLLWLCTGLEALLDATDDGEPGPGPGPSGIPDVGGTVIMSGNETGCNSVDEALADIPLTEMNQGLTDAWFEVTTDGQGFLITVFPEISQVFLAWFTYDTERPPEDVMAILGEPGHRWLTAQGEYSGNEALLDVWMAEGGVFDSSEPAPSLRKDGEIILKFTTCNSGSVNYDIPSISRRGRISLERIVLDNVSLCHALENAN